MTIASTIHVTCAGSALVPWYLQDQMLLFSEANVPVSNIPVLPYALCTSVSSMAASAGGGGRNPGVTKV